MRRSLVLRSLFVSVLIVLVFVVPLAILISRVADERAVTLGRSDALALSPILSIAGDPRVTGAIVSVSQRARPRDVSVVFPDGRETRLSPRWRWDALSYHARLAKAEVRLSPFRGRADDDVVEEFDLQKLRRIRQTSR